MLNPHAFIYGVSDDLFINSDKKFSFVSNNEIFMVSADCSSGKTTAVCQTISDGLLDANHLYVAPSLLLVRQTSAVLSSLGVPHKVITSETSSSVRADIIRHLNGRGGYGHVLLITWEAYVYLPYFHDGFKARENWTVFIDEVPRLDEFYDPMIPYHVSELASLLDVEPMTETLGRVRAKDERELRRFLDRAGDDMDDVIRPLLRDVLSPNHDVFLDLLSWQRLADLRNIDGNRDERNRLFFLSILTPRAFLCATLLGAHIENYMLFYWFRRYHDTRFSKNRAIIRKLRDVPDRANQVAISYFLSKRRMSKYIGNKSLANGQTMFELMDSKTAEVFANEEFLFVCNRDREAVTALRAASDGQSPSSSLANIHHAVASAAGGLPYRAVPMPVKAHGLNDYTGYTRLYFSPALNRKPAHYMMLHRLGFTNEVIHKETAEVAYQCVMRTALREPAFSGKVEVIVPDIWTAKMLAAHFGGGDIMSLLNERACHVEPLGAGDKDKRYKATRILDRLITENSDKSPRISKGLGRCFRQRRAPNRPTYHATAIGDLKNPETFKAINAPLNVFQNLLRSFSKVKREKKEDVALICPSIFSPDDVRSDDTFVAAYFMVLDFDKGTLTPGDFEKIFWQRRGHKRPFILHSTWSRSPEQPNRFRVWLPFKKPCMSKETYEAIYKDVVARITNAGFTKKDIGLDPKSRSPVQAYYLPAINPAHPEWALFIDRGTRQREIEAYAIDPAEYEPLVVQETAIGDGEAGASPKAMSDDLRAQIRNEADEITKDIMCRCSDRHNLLFELARKLQIISPETMETELIEVATGDKKMERKVRDIMKQARQGYFSSKAQISESHCAANVSIVTASRHCA